MEKPDSLNLLPGIIFMSIAAIIIAIAVFTLNFLNQKRNDAIVLQYTQETNQYIKDNQSTLVTLFDQTFTKAQSCQNNNSSLKETNKIHCETVIGQEIENLIYPNLNTLKDHSSTFFIKLITPDTIQVLRLSGYFINETKESFSQQESKKNALLLALLSNEINQIPWDDYFYYISGEEVIIPVDIDGKRLGAIVRRVIE